MNKIRWFGKLVMLLVVVATCLVPLIALAQGPENPIEPPIVQTGEQPPAGVDLPPQYAWAAPFIVGAAAWVVKVVIPKLPKFAVPLIVTGISALLSVVAAYALHVKNAWIIFLLGLVSVFLRELWKQIKAATQAKSAGQPVPTVSDPPSG